jgi:uncharacterized protein
LSDSLWAALALVLILEGLLPFISPGAWRRVFSEMLQMRDGQIRFFGLLCLVAGATLWWLVT